MGYIGKGSNTQVLRDNAANVLPSFAAVSGAGAFVLLQTQTASNSATITFNSSVITNTYANYFLIYTGVLSSLSTDELIFQYSTNNGSTYVASGYQSGLNANAYNTGGWGNDSTTTSGFLADTISATTGHELSGHVFLYNVSNGKAISYEGHNVHWAENLGLWEQIVYFGGSTTTSANNIKFFMNSAGVIKTGVFSLYGITQ